MKLGAAGVEVERGTIRNRFQEVPLGKHHEVLVPTLVVVTEDEIEPMFTLRTEVSKTDDRRIRIMASCITEHECHGMWLVDDGDKNATEFFKPQQGLVLKEWEVPSIIMHAFGWTGGLRSDVADLYEEATTEPWVGRVARVR